MDNNVLSDIFLNKQNFRAQYSKKMELPDKV